ARDTAPRARDFTKRSRPLPARERRERDNARPERTFTRRSRDAAPPERDFSRRARPGRPPFERARPDRPRPLDERPRFERPRDERPRHDRPRDERTGRARPGEDRARPGERPRFERPRFQRPRIERTRTDRPRDDRGPGARTFHDDGGDQTGAVTRSRPASPQGPNVRWRRDGRPSARPPAWGGPRDGAPDGRHPASRGEPRSHAPAPERRDHRRGFPPVSTDGPSLPADPREAALRILHAVDTRSAFSDRLLDGAHARPGAEPRDRALLHELVKGALRWRGRLDAALDARVHVGLANTQPWIRNVLRLGAYQILFLDRVPAHAAVDESVKLAH